MAAVLAVGAVNTQIESTNLSEDLTWEATLAQSLLVDGFFGHGIAPLLWTPGEAEISR